MNKFCTPEFIKPLYTTNNELSDKNNEVLNFNLIF